ncbi:hypothetical protein [Halogranum amylolyticum]|uniref:hypothetical protein n=1 Tax=Halogranum amylolyticum TaxID=660520 RepID=UPI001114DC7C|nr:hypothetical protein [Halogranum amylolyticum]
MSLLDMYLAKEIVGKLQGARKVVEQSVEESIDDLLQSDTIPRRGEGDDSFDRWLGNWVECVEKQGEGPARLILGWEPESLDEACQILREGAASWSESTGKDMVEFAKEYSPVVDMEDGSRMEFDWWFDFAKMLPRCRSKYIPIG